MTTLKSIQLDPIPREYLPGYFDNEQKACQGTG
jgi:hypothetical protein